MNHFLDNDKYNHFSNPVWSLLDAGKKGLLLAFGFTLVLILQLTFFSSEAIASPLAGLFGSRVEDVKTDITTINKEAGNQAKELAKNVKEGTKDNIGKAKEVAKDTKDKIGDGVDKVKEMASDRTDAVKDGAKDLQENAGNKVDEAIDSVKNFLGQ